jgi:hypothetical protein
VNREKVEKDRLRDRREKFSSYAEPGALLKPDALDSALYLSESDRFFTDVAAEQRHLRQEATQRREADLLRRRTEATEREERRWAEMEAQSHAFDDRTKELQQDGRPAQKNKSGQPFDPITQAYTTGEAGAVMRYADERVRWKASVRAEYLAAHSAGSSYNPLTGEGAYTYKAPPAPRPQDSGMAPGVSAEQALELARKYR